MMHQASFSYSADSPNLPIKNPGLPFIVLLFLRLGLFAFYFPLPTPPPDMRDLT